MVEDDFWGDTAQVDLVLMDRGRLPDVDVTASPYPGELGVGTGRRNWPSELAVGTGRRNWASELGVSASPQAWLSRQVSVSGTVVITTVRRTAASRRPVVVPGAAGAVREALVGSLAAGG